MVQPRHHAVWVPAFAGTTAICAALAFVLFATLPLTAFATGTAPAAEPPVDPAPCLTAVAAGEPDGIIAACGALIADDRTPRETRIKALVGRGGAYARGDMVDRAIADYDAVLRLDPTSADIFNARGELWRGKGDRPRALADFGAAIKLDPRHEAARANYKSLALELERIGAQMAIKKGPTPANPGPPLK